MDIEIKLKNEVVYSTKTSRNDKLLIKYDTYMFQESVRVVKFTNGLDERVIIPFESIDRIIEKRIDEK